MWGYRITLDFVKNDASRHKRRDRHTEKAIKPTKVCELFQELFHNVLPEIKRDISRQWTQCHQEDIKKKPPLNMHAPNYSASISMSQEAKEEQTSP